MSCQTSHNRHPRKETQKFQTSGRIHCRPQPPGSVQPHGRWSDRIFCRDAEIRSPVTKPFNDDATDFRDDEHDSNEKDDDINIGHNLLKTTTMVNKTTRTESRTSLYTQDRNTVATTGTASLLPSIGMTKLPTRTVSVPTPCEECCSRHSHRNQWLILVIGLLLHSGRIESFTPSSIPKAPMHRRGFQSVSSISPQSRSPTRRSVVDLPTSPSAHLVENEREWDNSLPESGSFQEINDQRYSASDWMHNIKSLPRSSILREIRRPVLSIVSWSTFVSTVHGLLRRMGREKLASRLCISSKPHSLLVSALGLLLVFRTNSAYQRFAVSHSQVAEESLSLGPFVRWVVCFG